ncbi:MAG TPA: VWA domain-containing protein [Thermoanaerobaculia bacterium]|nr:VWA domain-containing protein [Thermoanaerobaculia bacterium]
MVPTAGLTFRDPLMLWTAILTPLLLALLVATERRRRRAAARFISERLRGIANLARPVRAAFLFLAFLLAVAALAGPQYGYEIRSIESSQGNRIIVLDTSLSMAAEDIGTSRLTAAKAVAKRLIHDFDGKVALVLFEGSAETACPLTTDTSALETMLDSVEPGEMSEPGSDLGAALTHAIHLADGLGDQPVQVMLISDGEDRGDGLDKAIGLATQRRIRVSTILIGSPSGATIPAEGTQLHDEDGQVVVTAAHPDTLAMIAHRTSGRAYVNPFAEASLNTMDEQLTVSAGNKAQERQSRIPIDRYQWPLGFSIAMFFLASIANRGAE